MTELKVSVIVPLYNEERFIKGCIDSLIAQTFPKSQMEWIFIDGRSSDKTVEIINEYSQNDEYPIVLLDNEQRKTPYALNLGIKNSKGKYIVRLDAHSYFYPDYIEKCVYYLDTMDVDNVGGVAETEADGFVGNAIAKMISTKLGVGGSDFRVGEGNKYVDTVPFGAFKREVFERVGLFNPKLLRSEDNDMNSRIRESGGKIWLAEDIRFKYFCRDTVKGILKMALQNGNALLLTTKENPKAMSLRHFIPFLFVLSLLVLPLLAIISPIFKWLLIAETTLYFVLTFVFSFLNKDFKYGIITIWLYPLFHITYGLGSLWGMFNISLY